MLSECVVDFGIACFAVLGSDSVEHYNVSLHPLLRASAPLLRRPSPRCHLPAPRCLFSPIGPRGLPLARRGRWRVPRARRGITSGMGSSGGARGCRGPPAFPGGAGARQRRRARRDYIIVYARLYDSVAHTFSPRAAVHRERLRRPRSVGALPREPGGVAALRGRPSVRGRGRLLCRLLRSFAAPQGSGLRPRRCVPAFVPGRG